MTTLYVEIEGQGHYLELYENDPINLTVQYSDVEEIQKAVGSYSQTFRIPASDANFAAFGDFANPNHIGVDFKRKIDAILYHNTVPVKTGFVQFKKAFVVNGRHTEYELVFFADAVNLAKEVGDAKLSDLDLSAFEHEVNYANVTSSWFGLLLSGDVRYAMIDKWRNWNNNGGGTALIEENALLAGDFTPALRTREIVKAIFDQAGLVLDSDFFTDSAFDEYYTPLHNGEKYPAGTVDQDNMLFVVGSASDQVVAGNSGYTQVVLSDSSPFSDPEDVVASNVFTAPYDGTFTIQLNGSVTAAAQTFVSIGLRFVSTGLFTPLVGNSPVAGGGTFLYNDTQSIEMQSGEQLELVVDGLAVSVTVNSGLPFEPDATWVQLVDATEQIYGQTLDPAANAPDIKQIDYLKGLQAMFNLVFVQDKLDPKKVKVEPFEQYVTGGEIKNWTDQLDTSKDIVVSPTTDLQKNRYEWTYSKDGDVLNKLYEDQADRIYGRYLVEDGENDFATGENKVESTFGAFPLSLVSGTSIRVFKAFNSEGEPVKKPKARVIYWGGLIDCETYYAYNDGTDTNVALSQYPYFGHYSAPNPAVSDIDLNFGGEVPAHPIQANPYNNLFNTYWRNYVNQLYSDQARIMEAYFDLTAADIADFEFNNQIWVKNSYWRVLKIDYSPNSNATSKVKLIQILDDVLPCSEIPVSINVNGVINFEDENGDPATPSQECCERFGYVFTNSKCYQQGFEPTQPPLPPNPNGGTQGTTKSKLQGNFWANGSNVIAEPNTSGFVTGDNITIKSGARNVMAQGQEIEVVGKPNIAATGANVDAFVEGVHRGGGWLNNDFSDRNGRWQHGRLSMFAEGDLDKGDDLELLIEGKDGNRLVLPDETAWCVRVDIIVATLDAKGGLKNLEHLVFSDIWYKKKGAAGSHYATHTSKADIAFGDFGGGNKFHLDVDTTTDTTQHRVLLHNQSARNTDTTRVNAVVNYWMTND